MKYKFSELDLIFLSYDESRDENWYRVKEYRPNAKRIHAVKGFDRAHKICAEISESKRLIIVDGDNWLHDDLVDNTYGDIVIDDSGVETACFSFSSINSINGLSYGNGGIKIWDRTSLLTSNTHESGNSTDFCWEIPYFQDNRALSLTIQNNTSKIAWRSGFREAVKMTQCEGQPRAFLESTWHLIHDKNLSRLNVWLSIGRDVQNGIWAILGARQAIYELMTNSLDHSLINNYDWFDDKWLKLFNEIDGYGPEKTAQDYSRNLLNEFNFYIPEIDSRQSEWFKRTYINPVRKGLMR